MGLLVISTIAVWTVGLIKTWVTPLVIAVAVSISGLSYSRYLAKADDMFDIVRDVILNNHSIGPHGILINDLEAILSRYKSIGKGNGNEAKEVLEKIEKRTEELERLQAEKAPSLSDLKAIYQ